MRKVFLFERGINGYQGIFGDWNDWPNQAIVWTHKNTDSVAQTLIYFTTPITAGITRARRAQFFAEMARQYNGWEINIAAHSEGTATVLQALTLPQFPRINRLHLLCGACDADFNRNGLNTALSMDNVKHVTCYIADRDDTMKIENTPLGLFLFKIPFHDHSLGLRGPVNVSQTVAGSVSVKHWPRYGHSDCFAPCNFRCTMKEIYS